MMEKQIKKREKAMREREADYQSDSVKTEGRATVEQCTAVPLRRFLTVRKCYADGARRESPENKRSSRQIQSSTAARQSAEGVNQ